ncbi:MAG: hypothetical protein KDI36_04180 [Pseudomonadales bacterium]|nr:hypothetical protein [Pseudomonadales bacterium]
MLDTLKKLSVRFAWARLPLVMLGLVSAGLFVASIFGWVQFTGQDILIPSLTGALWSGLLWTLIASFPNVPDKPPVESRLLLRLRTGFQRALLMLLAVIVLGLTVILLYLTFKLFGIHNAQALSP